MRKRTMFLLTILSTILSVVYSILTYCGIVRLWSLKFSKPQKYIENYRKIPKNEDEQKITLSFYVENQEDERAFINSILDQTISVNDIIAIVPDETEIPLDSYLRKVATIVPIGKDYGELNKILPTLMREKNCDTTIISLRSDKVYGKDYIYAVYEKSKEDPDTALILEDAIVVKPSMFGCVVDESPGDTSDFSLDWLLSKSKVKSKVCNNLQCDKNFSV